MLGPLIFNIIMNDLVYAVNQSTLSAYADDTQTFFGGSKAEKVVRGNKCRSRKCRQVVRAQRNEEERFQIPSNCNAMAKSQVIPQFYCESTAIPITGELEMLGVAIDDKTKFERHIGNICRKVSEQIAVLERMKKILPFESRECLYLRLIIPHFNFCSETWHFCKNITAKLEKVMSVLSVLYSTQNKCCTVNYLIK